MVGFYLVRCITTYEMKDGEVASRMVCKPRVGDTEKEVTIDDKVLALENCSSDLLSSPDALWDAHDFERERERGRDCGIVGENRAILWNEKKAYLHVP